MPDPTDCLSGLIGLSAAGSSCFPLPAVVAPATNEPITASASGLYLDTVEGLLLKPASGQPAGLDLYTRLANARDLAIPLVATALTQRSRLATGKPLYAERGTLGGLGNGTLLPPGSPARMELYTNATRTGALRLLSLQLYTDVAVTDVPVLLDGAPIGTLSAGGPAGLFRPIAGAEATRIRLDGNVHTLEAVLPEGVRVRSNNLWCAPCQRSTPWGQSLGRNLSAVSATASGGGFAVQVQEECTETADLLCYALQTDPELKQAVAFAVLYKAAELFVMSLSVGAQANRYLMLEPKELDALGAYYASKNNNPADGFIAWLSGPDGLARVKNPCYAGPPSPIGIQRTL